VTAITFPAQTELCSNLGVSRLCCVWRHFIVSH
jgi:DNA-directed RNA polymerase subunit N (RpoN/RPB10)